MILIKAAVSSIHRDYLDLPTLKQTQSTLDNYQKIIKHTVTRK
jgi:hypothetical protein